MALLHKQATTSHTLATRQAILALGYRPVPCKGKYPAKFEGWSQCNATAENIIAWEESHPENTNTGILTGDVVALDVDILRPDLADAIAAMVRELPGGVSAPKRVGKAPKAMYLFRTTEPREKAATDWFKIDGTDQRIEVMGTGQQVIVDGIHPDTRQPYTWDRELPAAADLPLLDWPSLESMLADASTLLAQHAEVRKPAPAPRRAANDNVADNYFRRVNQAALDDLAAWVPALALPKTKRHGEGFRAVCAWRGVKNANLSFHPAGITDFGSGETHTAIDVAVNAGKGDGVASAAEWLCGQLGKRKEDLGWVDKGAPMMPTPEAIKALVASKPKAQVSIIDPFTPEAAGGLMGEIATWILDTSRRRTPEFAVMAAVAFMSGFYGRRVIGPTSAGVNLYLAGIAGPGFGKEHPQASVLRLFEDAKMPDLIGPGEVTSASAIEKELRKHPVLLMVWDEMGEVLQSVNASGAGNWTATIRKIMLEAFSKATGVYRGKERAALETVAEPIYAPSMSIWGMSTPARFYSGLSEANLSDGFIARMIFVSPKNRPQRANPRDDGLTAPKPLLESIKDATAVFPWPKGGLGISASKTWKDSAWKPSFLKVPWADAEAEKAWLDIEDWQDAEIIKDETRDGIIGRTAEHVVKLATIRALSRDAAKPAVSVEDIEWARAFMMASIEAIEGGVDKYMAGSQFEAVCKAILAALRHTKDGTLFRAELLKRRGVSKSDERMVEGAIRRLQETGDIERSDGKKVALTPAGWG